MKCLDHQSTAVAFRLPVTTGSGAWFLLVALLVLGCPLGYTPAKAAPGVASSDVRVASDTLKISLDECVALALRRNVSIRVAYMDRALARFNFVTNHDYAFRPNVGIGLTGGRSGSGETSRVGATGGSDKVTSALNVSNRLPTGGSVTVSSNPWSRSRARSQRDFEDAVDQASIDRSWSISLSQPLLRGAFTDYGTSDRRKFTIGERQNILALKEAVMAEIMRVIRAYRSLLQARWNLDINRQALERARTQAEMSEKLIAMGRMPRMELIQSRSDVANRQLSLESATNECDQARIALLKLLDLDVSTRIEPVGELEQPVFSLTEQEVADTIRAHQPAYLTARLGLETSRIDLMRARRDQRWDLTLTAAYARTRTDLIPGDATRGHEWSVDLGLDVPVYGSDRRAQRSAVLGASNELNKAVLQFRKLEDDIRLEARDRVQQIGTLARQVELASAARDLTEQKLAFEREKLKTGRTTNFQVVSFQDEVRNAHITELTARIAYLNALDDLDLTMGTTVRTWGVILNENAPGRGPVQTASASAGVASPAAETEHESR
ncbi:MAG TPA: TolC family protein [Candidatus Ozemobacteraceae bacterium]|nr:TolC family protein [Candidatus Ozemobacteraceae bacterium]